ncbi:VOC family protein [Neorhizobium sp. T25_13]|uniref:VOC family protein n=1 Tax=Neorhizobium sp. T25_13 TaxID=2093830 RepID=UPI000CF9CD79|nr:VOC family protein [Neorhizobium sp. T25_13]
MQFGHIELFASNLHSSKTFYELLGWEVTQASDSCVWLRMGGSELLLRRGSPTNRSTEYKDTAIALVLYCDELPQQIEKLSAQGIYPSGNDGSINEPTFKDPDGYWIQIVNPADFT